MTSKHDFDVDNYQNLAYIVLPFLKHYKCPHIIYIYNDIPLYIVIPYILYTQKKTDIFVWGKSVRERRDKYSLERFLTFFRMAGLR